MGTGGVRVEEARTPATPPGSLHQPSVVFHLGDLTRSQIQGREFPPEARAGLGHTSWDPGLSWHLTPIASLLCPGLLWLLCPRKGKDLWGGGSLPQPYPATWWFLGQVTGSIGPPCNSPTPWVVGQPELSQGQAGTLGVAGAWDSSQGCWLLLQGAPACRSGLPRCGCIQLWDALTPRAGNLVGEGGRSPKGASVCGVHG